MSVRYLICKKYNIAFSFEKDLKRDQFIDQSAYKFSFDPNDIFEIPILSTLRVINRVLNGSDVFIKLWTDPTMKMNQRDPLSKTFLDVIAFHTAFTLGLAITQFIYSGFERNQKNLGFNSELESNGFVRFLWFYYYDKFQLRVTQPRIEI